ncbi:hypothetical protein [Nonomuraea sp. bgisy101]|uniref:hypothetical protein n=1 Tax=Nonomuraea sp. bgisy101 TaxID=3413784 RepID=UPI003D71C8AA
MNKDDRNPQSSGPRHLPRAGPRLGHDRARVLNAYAGLGLHQLRHSAATRLGDPEAPCS